MSRVLGGLRVDRPTFVDPRLLFVASFLCAVSQGPVLSCGLFLPFYFLFFLFLFCGPCVHCMQSVPPGHLLIAVSSSSGSGGGGDKKNIV